jgi:hypothetical protein
LRGLSVFVKDGTLKNLIFSDIQNLALPVVPKGVA